MSEPIVCQLCGVRERRESPRVAELEEQLRMSAAERDKAIGQRDALRNVIRSIADFAESRQILGMEMQATRTEGTS